ncbi:DUF1569 domain-containing protein [Chryseobacterium sp.]|uniref:DUF1569 domain-containing protein n=1 Tax=Chryseobacterium sp. TaxID=1871047 RepID=UPI002899CED3|nr:DUF1569 domain-containing protein [Chryseobacterium sp.]
MPYKSLHNEEDFEEIKRRILQLSIKSQNKWGKMNVAQMMVHCDKILQIALGSLKIPSVFWLFRLVGVVTKYEISAFNNGIPRNMPTFKKVIVNFDCDFEQARNNLLVRLDEYKNAYLNHQLPLKHELFGRMREKDWGFLEYKHLDHHLKQFKV